MSKCTITIEFDQADRTFNAGELITGKVYVTPNIDMSCNGVLVELAWATHGRGNHAGAVINNLQYDGMEFTAGKTIAYEFRFTTPASPLTYHGHYLNVDHYIKARLDVPWSLDPKAAEEYILLPGPACASLGAVHSITKTGSAKKGAGCVAAVAAVIVIVALLTGFIPVLIGAVVVMAFMGFMAFRNSMAARTLGGVTMTISLARATPGQHLPVSVEFSPAKPVRITGVTATLKGSEKVISGSGTKKTTHSKTIFTKHFILSESAQLHAGRQVIAGNLPIPQTDAWTFHANDNQLTWTVSIRVAIPGWPDWVDEAELELIPDVNSLPASKTLAGKASSSSPPPPPPPPLPPIPNTTPPVIPTARPTEEEPPPIPEATPPVIPTAHPAEEAPPEAIPPPQNESPAEPSATSDGAVYASDLNTIVSADRFGSERTDLINKASERTYDLEVTVKSASWTLEASLPLEYRNGRTIIAIVEGADSAEIAVYLPENANKAIDAVAVGTTLRLTVRPRKFNKFYNRMEALAEEH